MTSKKPLVSIIVPIYNVSKYIEKCVVSLFEQTYNNIEYIFVNDCTPDNSADILRGIIEKYPNRTNIKTIVHEHNKGLGAARLTGFNASTGEYILNVDSDDYISIDAVTTLIDNISSTNADLVIFDYYLQWSKTNKKCNQVKYSTKEQVINAMLKGQMMPSIFSKFIKRELYIKNNLYPIEGVDIGEDLIFVPKIVLYAQNISFVSKALYFYNQDNVNSYTKNYSKKTIDNVVFVLNDLIEFYSNKDNVTFNESLSIGYQVKKADLLLNSSNIHDFKYICSLMPTKNQYKQIRLIDRLTLYLAEIKLFHVLKTYNRIVKTMINIVQILKGRRR